MSAWERLWELLFPPKCPFCGRVADGLGVCPKCRAALPWVEGKQGFSLGDLSCAAPLWYEGLAREGILRFKFQGASAGAECFGALLAQCAEDRFSGGFDAVTWAPVSRRRLRQRGYDQSRLLAEAMCRRWGAVPTAMLRKTADNPPQSGLADAARRRANVLGVYEAEKAAACGRRILLVDDVVTTGATLRACADELRRAGAESVVCLTLARTRPAARRGRDVGRT